MGRTPREAAAALIRERAPAILPRVVADAAAGDASERDTLDLQRRLTTFLERRIPPWVEALEADHSQRLDAIGRLLQTDAEAAEHISEVGTAVRQAVAGVEDRGGVVDEFLPDRKRLAELGLGVRRSAH